MRSETCPACGANMRGDPIPERHQGAYGGELHFSRWIALYDSWIALYDIGRDCTSAWRCPDCGAEFPR